MTLPRRSFFAALAALVVAPKVLKSQPRVVAPYVPLGDFAGLRALVDDGTYPSTLHGHSRSWYPAAPRP